MPWRGANVSWRMSQGAQSIWTIFAFHRSLWNCLQLMKTLPSIHSSLLGKKLCTEVWLESFYHQCYFRFPSSSSRTFANVASLMFLVTDKETWLYKVCPNIRKSIRERTLMTNLWLRCKSAHSIIHANWIIVWTNPEYLDAEVLVPLPPALAPKLRNIANVARCKGWLNFCKDILPFSSQSFHNSFDPAGYMISEITSEQLVFSRTGASSLSLRFQLLWAPITAFGAVCCNLGASIWL